MERTGLRFYRVESDVGMMGGLGAHEYMAPCPAGEDEVALGPEYAANVEVARSSPDVEQDGERLLLRGEPLEIEPAIEVGNIFKLGTRYSEPLGATYLDERGEEHPIWMGSYGIGPARIVAAAVEQFADEHGISWPRALAPFAVHLVALGKPGTPERDAAERLYDDAARRAASRCSTTTANGRPGEKFADAELLGCPLRLTVGRRSLESGEIEVQVRRGLAGGAGPAPGRRAFRARPGGGRAVAEPPVGEPGDPRSAGGAAATPATDLRAPVRARPLRRAAGGDAGRAARCARGRSPTLIGFARLALIPVFLIVAFSSGDGTSALAATLFAVIGWGDYADGIAARVTRQYSRLGALMDPVTDRLLVVSGVVVCWHFQLLPRWALAVLAGRELLMLALGEYALRHGVELRINWPGRLAVAPGDGLVLLRDGRPADARPRAALRGARARARWRACCTCEAACGCCARTPGQSLKLSLSFWSILAALAVLSRMFGAGPAQAHTRRRRHDG